MGTISKSIKSYFSFSPVMEVFDNAQSLKTWSIKKFSAKVQLVHAVRIAQNLIFINLLVT